MRTRMMRLLKAPTLAAVIFAIPADAQRIHDKLEILGGTPEEQAEIRRGESAARAIFEKHIGDGGKVVVVVGTAEQIGARLLRSDPASAMLPWRTDVPGGVYHSKGVLEHEMCHAFLTSHVNAFVAREGIAADKRPLRFYGHHLVPDWLDEGVATLCEPPESRRERRIYLVAGWNKRYALSDFFRMSHPNLASGEGEGGGSGFAAASPGVQRSDTTRNPDGSFTVNVTTVRQDVTTRERLPFGTDSVLIFYGQAENLTAYIARVGGDGALKRLVESLVKSNDIDRALRAVGKVPPTIDALERDWTEAAKPVAPPESLNVRIEIGSA